MRCSVHDTNQPHHVVEWRDEIGKLGEYCKCGWMPPNSPDTGNYGHVHINGRLTQVNVLHEHIKNNFDGRCHFKQYGMECTRFAGHRGIHRPKTTPADICG